MDLTSTVVDFLTNMSMGLKLVLGLFFFIASVGQWKLYDKAGQNGWAIFVPIYNLMVLNRVVGRPDSHVWYYFIPVYNIYFVCKIWIEVCQSFGKTTIADYVFAIVLNGLYMLNLGLSADEDYVGPAYKAESTPKSGGIGKAEFA